jgi:hypothetical protein
MEVRGSALHEGVEASATALHPRWRSRVRSTLAETFRSTNLLI